MHSYGVRDVEKLLHLPRSTIRRLVDAGFVSPARGARRSWLFSFQDLIVLRVAQALAAAKIPPKRITKSLKALRRRLPETMPLSGLSIGAVADRVIVKEGRSRWQADSGQYLLGLEIDAENGSLSVIQPSQPGSPESTEDWLERALALEGDDPEAARKAYEQVLAADPAHLTASINLGRLLHESRRLAEAEAVYREALAEGGDDALLLFNLGVLLEDMKRKTEAMWAYEKALEHNPRMADCHYNLALLCKELGKPKEAIRHMAQYRRLVRSPRD